jgi:hypothetical protein
MEPRGPGSTTATPARSPGSQPPAEPPPDAGPPTGEPPGSGPEPDRGRAVGWGLGLIGVGALWLASIAGVEIRWDLVVPVTLVIIGVLVLARRRDDAGGLIGLGIVVMIIGLVTPGVLAPSAFTAGERTHTVTDVADLDDRYALGAGELVLDLRDLELTEAPVTVAARVTFGELTVLVPEDVGVGGDARVAFGEVATFDRTRGGIAPSATLDEEAGEGNETLELDLRVSFGRIEVRR